MSSHSFQDVQATGELARLTTGDAKGDLKSPSFSPFPFPVPGVAWVEHRTELQIFYFTRMERVQLDMLMPRNIFQVVTGTPTSYYIFTCSRMTLSCEIISCH